MTELPTFDGLRRALWWLFLGLAIAGVSAAFSISNAALLAAVDDDDEEFTEVTAAERQPNPKTGEVGPIADRPIVAAFERFHASDGADVVAGGLLLLGELNCTSCHAADAASDAIAVKQGPLLGDVAGRADVEHVGQFIFDPHGTKPGTTMPSVISTLPEAQRGRAAEALAHYFLSIRKSTFALSAPDGAAVARGEAQFHQVGCVACHAPRRELTADLDERIGVSIPLGKLDVKYSIASLSAFLSDPLVVRPSGRMPHMALTAAQAGDIASYLLKDTDAPAPLHYAYYEGSWNDFPDFDKLQPVHAGNASSFGLGQQSRNDAFGMRFDGFLHVAEEGDYQFWLSSDDGSRLFIDEKIVVDHGGIHGTTTKDGRTRLTAGLHPIRVEYFEQAGEEVLTVEYAGPRIERQLIPASALSSTDKPQGDKPTFELDAKLAAKGKVLFATVGCASCHQLGPGFELVESKVAGPPLAQLDATKGCLSDPPSGDVPHYSLSARQRIALSAALAAIRTDALPKKSPASRVHQTMTALNCYACHARGEIGGVPATRNEFFTADDKDLGDEGRLPPLLTGAGDKLQDKALDAILTSAAVARPYMHARMPQFGAANLGAIAADMIASDRVDAKLPEVPDAHNQARHAGWKLVGKNGLTCISCHTFNQHKSSGIQSMDLAIMGERLRPEWLHRYLLEPQAFRPGTRMPQAWPGGKTTRPEVLSGDTNRQINAVIAFLSEGRRARIPEGVIRSSLELIVGGEAVVYRGFLDVAGARGIAVGYPEQVNLAFDPVAMRLAMLWKGRFFDASKHWQGRGNGFQGPAGDDVLRLVDGAPLARLEDAQKTPWPKETGKEAGYRFRGYRLDALRRPTFRYDYGAMRVDDYPVDQWTEGGPVFTRTVTLAAAEPAQDLYFRAAAGDKIEKQGDGSFVVDGRLKLRIETGEDAKPIVRRVGSSELIVPVKFDGGKAKFVLRYAW